MKPRPRSRVRLVTAAIVAALALSACTGLPVPGPRTSSYTPRPTPPPQTCFTWGDQVAAYFDGIEGITQVEVKPRHDLCGGDGSYEVVIHAATAPSAATIKATWAAYADAWETLDQVKIAAREPTLVVHYGEHLIETGETALRLDDKMATAIAGLTAGSWQAVFRGNFAGGTDYADIPPDRQVLRLWLTEEPGTGLAPIADIFVPMWLAAAAAAEAAGWYRGEIGLSAYSAGDMDLPVAPGSQPPTGLADAFVAGHEFSRASGASIGPVNGEAKTVHIRIVLPYNVDTLDAATQAKLDEMVATIKALGFKVDQFVGHVIE